MSQRILDEREHRRGLVLGLTLAEILILLLFLLLLALGARLGQLQREVTATQRELDRSKADLVILKSALPADMKEFATLKAENADLKEQQREVRPALDAAAKIDPEAPPATTLKRGIDALTPDQIKALSQMSANARTKTKGTTAHNENKGDKSKDAKSQEDKSKNGTGEHDWPPIIILSEAAGYFFESGSAELSAAFQGKLATSVIDRILEIVKQYKVDVVEVVGHTDERPFNVRQVRLEPTADSPMPTSRPRLFRRPSNLDVALFPFLGGKGDSERLVPADNAGLGLARAASVVRILAKDRRLDNVRLLPLSGGQLIQVGDILSAGSPGDVKERRRIEIRARRSDKSAHPWEGRVSQDAPLVTGK
jgi:flagellar motor protein MotB